MSLNTEKIGPEWSVLLPVRRRSRTRCGDKSCSPLR